MNRLALVNRDSFGRPIDSSLTQSGVGDQAGQFALDPAGLLDVFAHIHALGLANLASGSSLAAQSDGSTTDQRRPLPPEEAQAPSGGLLPFLIRARAPDVSPLVANAAPGMTGATTASAADAGQGADRARQRYVSGFADQVNGGASDATPWLLARSSGVTNCDNARDYCMGVRGLRGRRTCEKLRTLCLDGVPGIFGPGVGGSRVIE